MKTDKITAIYFSPTGTTKKIVDEIALGFHAASVEQMDLTLPTVKSRNIGTTDQLVIIGAPVYFGRVPPVAAQRMKQVKANKIPAVIVVVYGNRDYEDALLELSELAKEAGFIPVAGAAFIGEHSYSTAATPIAAGRPDERDLLQAREFGAAVMKKMVQIKSPGTIAALPLPGTSPFKDLTAWPDMAPTIVEDLCNLCKICASLCPTAAITVDATVVTDKSKCITCCACVKSCPIDARVMKEPMLEQIAQWLSTTLQERKAPQTFV
jgi:ferredoxin